MVRVERLLGHSLLECSALEAIVAAAPPVAADSNRATPASEVEEAAAMVPAVMRLADLVAVGKPDVVADQLVGAEPEGVADDASLGLVLVVRKMVAAGLRNKSSLQDLAQVKPPLAATFETCEMVRIEMMVGSIAPTIVCVE